MRALLFFIFFLYTIIAISKEKSDSTLNPVKFSGTISLNSNGIAPIPSFALGKPAISANLSIKKGRFSYDPQLSYGLDLKPWIIDNWFHYLLVVKPKFELRTGVNVSMFFSEYQTPNEVIWQGQRYFAFELAGFYKLTSTSSIGLMAWYDKGIDEGTISGYFINLVADKSDIPIGQRVFLAINLQLFYINYTDNNDGLFIAPKITLLSRDVPVSVFFQGIQPLTSNITPDPVFQWNLGIGYSF